MIWFIIYLIELIIQIIASSDIEKYSLQSARLNDNTVMFYLFKKKVNANLSLLFCMLFSNRLVK